MEVDKPFGYTSIARVRALGTYSSSDDTILTQIRLASSVINRITGQWFQPVGVDFRVSGRGDVMLHFPGMPPIIRIEELSYSPEGDVNLMDRYFIESGRRIIRLRGEFAGWYDGRAYLRWDSIGFPRRVGAMHVRGFFGWINTLNSFDEKNNVVPLDTTTTSTIQADSGSVTLGSVDGIRPGGAIAIGSTLQDTLPVFVSSVDTASNSITFDPIGDYLYTSLPVGTRVRAFGIVPPMLSKAAAMLAALYIESLEGASSSDGISGAAVARRLIMEKTEDYTYRLDSPIGGRDTGDSDFSVGDAEIDNILANFVAPPGIEFV